MHMRIKVCVEHRDRRMFFRHFSCMLTDIIPRDNGEHDICTVCNSPLVAAKPVCKLSIAFFVSANFAESTDLE